MTFNESLLSNSNYPPMSQYEWDNAPWNQIDPEPKSVDIIVSQTLSKSCSIETCDYIVDEDSYDFSNVNLDEEVYNQINTPLDLIKRFKEILRKIIQGYIFNNSEIKQAENLIKDCENWVEDDFAVFLE